MRRGCSARKGCPGPGRVGAAWRTRPWQNPGGNCGTRSDGTDAGLWRPAAGTRRRRPAAGARTGRTSAGPSTGPASSARPGTSATTTLRLTSRATRRPPSRRVAPSAQSWPPSSAEPTVRPGLARRVAVKRGREAGASLPNNPGTGCQRDEHYRSLADNGGVSGVVLAVLERPAASDPGRHRGGAHCGAAGRGRARPPARPGTDCARLHGGDWEAAAAHGWARTSHRFAED
jgi:hypothetical protein